MLEYAPILKNVVSVKPIKSACGGAGEASCQDSPVCILPRRVIPLQRNHLSLNDWDAELAEVVVSPLSIVRRARVLIAYRVCLRLGCLFFVCCAFLLFFLFWLFLFGVFWVL